jgi:pectinesterase
VAGQAVSGAGTGGVAGGAGVSGASGRAGAAGSSGSAGAGARAGASGAGDGPCAAPVRGTSTRPQLTDAEAEDFTIAKYLAKAGAFASLTTDDWDPTAGLGDAGAFTPDIVVAEDGSGDFTTPQAGLSAVSGSERRYVLVKPGTYRGQVSYTGSTPVTLYAAGTDPTAVVIVNDKSQAEGTSQTLNVVADDFQIMNLTLSNDFATPASGSNIQALALFTRGDKIVLENVRMHGFQDTVQFSAANPTTLNRVYVKGGFIEGDTDFIYGNATVVFDGVTVHYLSSRRGTGSGIIIAPSTSVGNELGFLFTACNFTADQNAPSNRIYLGRSWDASSTTPTPNGQAVLRDSTLGAHVDRDTPWTSAATSGRPYDSNDNRFYEYCNTGAGASP